jgi:hypothetical protein
VRLVRQPSGLDGGGIWSQNLRISPRGSFSTRVSLSKTIVARLVNSYAGQFGIFGLFGSPVLAKATQADANCV